jgi:hypothetical protein
MVPKVYKKKDASFLRAQFFNIFCMVIGNYMLWLMIFTTSIVIPSMTLSTNKTILTNDCSANGQFSLVSVPPLSFKISRSVKICFIRFIRYSRNLSHLRQRSKFFTGNRTLTAKPVGYFSAVLNEIVLINLLDDNRPFNPMSYSRLFMNWRSNSTVE